MKKILLVFDPGRTDTYKYFEQDHENSYYILFRESLSSDLAIPSFIKKEIFWKDFKTPFELLKQLKPDKVVFQEIIDIKQIALNVAAKHESVETILLDHGLW